MTPEEIAGLFQRAAEHYNERMKGTFTTTPEGQKREFEMLLDRPQKHRCSGPALGLNHVGLTNIRNYRGLGVYEHTITDLGLADAAALRGKE